MNKSCRDYWEDGKDYNSYVLSEFSDCRKDAWKAQIIKHLPKEKMLRVLDVGCGPGFFSCILSEEAHCVIGIDQSKDMLYYARTNAQNLGVNPNFIQMDAHDLQFADDSFDLIISRNVTWTFEDPERAYRQFYRTMKPGGLMLIYDANWHLPFYQPALMQQVQENERWYWENCGQKFQVYDDDTNIFEGLPLSNTLRPKWDIGALTQIGFRQITCLLNVGDSVYTPWEKRLYSATPMFEISAYK